MKYASRCQSYWEVHYWKALESHMKGLTESCIELHKAVTPFPLFLPRLLTAPVTGACSCTIASHFSPCAVSQIHPFRTS